MASKEASLKVAGHDAQLEFWNSPAKFRAFVGGRGSGKSLASIVEIIRQPAGSVGALVAPSYDTLNRGLLALFIEKFSPFIKSYTKNDRLILINGTKVYIRSAERIKNARGMNLHWLALDEGAYLDEEVFKTLIPSLRGSANTKVWITTTPNGLNWIYQMFVLDHADDPNYFLVHSKSSDNPFLPDDFVSTLSANFSSAYASQELDGLFIDLNNARVQRSWFQYGFPDKQLPVTLGVDLAISQKSKSDYTAIVAGCFDPSTGDRYVLDVQRGKKTFFGTQQFIKEMADKWNEDETTGPVVRINVEKVGYQLAAIQELIRTSSLPVKEYTPKGDKLQRFAPIEAQFENKHIFFNESLNNIKFAGEKQTALQVFEDELLSFPNSKNDDMVDALVMALDIPLRKRIHVF